MLKISLQDLKIIAAETLFEMPKQGTISFIISNTLTRDIVNEFDRILDDDLTAVEGATSYVDSNGGNYFRYRVVPTYGSQKNKSRNDQDAYEQRENSNYRRPRSIEDYHNSRRQFHRREDIESLADELLEVRRDFNSSEAGLVYLMYGVLNDPEYFEIFREKVLSKLKKKFPTTSEEARENLLEDFIDEVMQNVGGKLRQEWSA